MDMTASFTFTPGVVADTGRAPALLPQALALSRVSPWVSKPQFPFWLFSCLFLLLLLLLSHFSRVRLCATP